MSDPHQPQANPQEQQASFQIEKIYAKDVSLEIPNAPQVFVEQASPQLEVQIGSDIQNFAEGLYEVTVSATVTGFVALSKHSIKSALCWAPSIMTRGNKY